VNGRHDRDTYFEFVRERLVIEEDPRILIFPVPTILKLPHTLHYPLKLRIADEAD